MELENAVLLIVDDEKPIVEAIKLLLEERFPNILTANNGAEALKLIEGHKVDCILSDIKMPVMDGISFIKSVRQSGNKVPFIFFTAYGSENFMLEALKYGAFDFIEKPSFDNLEEVVSRGVAAGLQMKHPETSDDGQFISNYQKMLKNMP